MSSIRSRHRLALLFAACGAVAPGMASASFLEDLACPLFGCADGPAPRFDLSCSPATLVGEPSYRTQGVQLASYRFQGNCSNADHSKSVAYRVDASWSPDDRDPQGSNASEIVTISSNDRLSPDTRAQEGGGEYVEHVILGAHCDHDPWLGSAHCERVGDNLPDEVHSTWAQVPTRRFPITAGAIGAAERYRLRGIADAAFGGASGMRDSATEQVRRWPRDAGQDSTTEDSRIAAALRDGVDNDSVRVQVRYDASLGYRDAHGVFDPNPTSCDAFSISAGTGGGPRDDRSPQLIKVAPRPGMRRDGADYVCDYVVSYLPVGTPVQVHAAIGTPRAPSSEPWQGGANAQPPAYAYRAISDADQVVTLDPRTPTRVLVFRMAYAGGIGAAAVSQLETRDGSAVERAVRAAAKEPPICAYARSARARNSPAAPGLERQCRENGGTP